VWNDKASDCYDGVFLLSKYHRASHADVPDDKVIFTENGMDPDLYVPLEALTNIPTKMIWGSDPCRGVHLVLPHWKKIKEAVPEAEWHIYYGWSPHFMEGMKKAGVGKDIYDYVEANKDQPGIHWHGKVGQFELAQAYASSGVWGYPTDFPEIHCITAMKAQAHGCIPVVVDDFALSETVQFGNKLLGPMTEPENIERWVASVIDAMKNPWTREQRLEMATWARKHTWESVAKSWVEDFETRLASRVEPSKIPASLTSMTTS
jgi:glycosyltransferase involved in cell wall biosynthesis